MKSWAWSTVGESCELTSGGTPSKHNPNFWEGDLPFVSARDLKSDRIETATLHIARDAIKASSAKIAPVGSLLMLVRGMGLANGIQIGEVMSPVAFNQDIRAIHPPKAIVPRFLLLALRNSFLNGAGEEVLSSAAHGTLKIDTDALRNMAIPVPPLPEQQRIVGILDEAFAGIAAAKANAEKNLRNAREFFDGSSKTAFEKLAMDSNLKKLAEVCFVDRGSSPRPIKEYFTTAADGVNWIKIGDSVEGEKYIAATKQKITPKGALESVRVKAGDFLLTNSMSFGRPYILKTDGCIHDGWYCLRLNEGLDPDYFYYLLSSAYVRDQFNRLASGSVVLNISSDLVKRTLLPIPSLSEQRSAVNKLDSVRAETQRLASLYQQKLAALDALKKSLLHQAFTGQLT